MIGIDLFAGAGGMSLGAEMAGVVTKVAVPQSRSRFFIVGRLDAAPPVLPSIGNVPKVSVEDALHDLPSLTNGADVDILPYASEAQSGYARRMRNGLTECTGHIVSRNADLIVERYPFIPQGGNWADIPEELMASYKDRTRCHTGIYRRLDPAKPSVVIGNFRKNMLMSFHLTRYSWYGVWIGDCVTDM